MHRTRCVCWNVYAPVSEWWHADALISQTLLDTQELRSLSLLSFRAILRFHAPEAFPSCTRREVPFEDLGPCPVSLVGIEKAIAPRTEVACC